MTSVIIATYNGAPTLARTLEINPSAMVWRGAEGTVISLLRDFRAILAGEEHALTTDRTSPDRDGPLPRLMALERVPGIGDVGHYYLPYGETF